MASVDSAAPEQRDFVGSLLVADTRAFVEAWRALLSAHPLPSAAPIPSSPELGELRERSKTLQLRARAAGVGGLAHHLGVCNEHAEAGQRERLEQCLTNVLELAWQLSQELERGRPEEGEGSATSDKPTSAVLLVERDAHDGGEPPRVPPPALLHNPWPGWKRVSTAERAAPPPQDASPTADGLEDAPPTVRAPFDAQGLDAQALDALALDARAGHGGPEQAEPARLDESGPAELAIPVSTQADRAPALEVPSELAPTVHQPPPAVVESSKSSEPTLLQLGGTGGDRQAIASVLSPAPPPAPPLLSAEVETEAPPSEPVPSSRSVFAEPVLESGWVDDSASPIEPMEALLAEPFPLQPAARKRERAEAKRIDAERDEPERAAAERSRPAPPRPARNELAARVAELSAKRAAPPALVEIVPPPARLDSASRALEPLLPSEGAAAPGEELGLSPPREAPGLLSVPASPVLQRIPAPPGLSVELPGLPALSPDVSADEELTDQELEIRLERVRRAAPYPLGRGEVAIDLPPPSEPRFVRRPPRARLWWLTPLALGVLGGVALLALLLRPWREEASEPPATPQAATPQAATRSEALLPVQRLTDDREARLTLLALVQGGGKESNELSDLIREEVALVATALVEPCVPGSPSCRLAEQARQMLEQPPLEKPPQPAPAALGSWLEGLRQPLIGVKDDPRVQKLVDYHTSDPVGRELFQGLLFRCGAYHGLFSDTLMQHGLPLDLIAVPMVESGCVLDAESPVGARGLWQFMPATARAYHLKVQAGVLDERLNPVKATDAALEFLRDLRSKLGSWELALASYNMGPFGLVSRLNRAGPGTDFWDLVDAQRLPQETAAYVPRIEAYALILANLEHFRFDAAQQMLSAASAPLLVPAGTRLGQVARAVGSSQSRIRELNPDVLADIVPGAAGEEFTLRVPSDGAPRAREALERLVARADDADECVPANFDWGKQRLTKAMLSRCKR